MTQPGETGLIGTDTSIGAGNVIVLVIVLVAILFAAYYVTRLVSGKASSMMRSNRMRILDRLALSRDKQILVVRVGDEAYLIGVTNSQINTLAKLPGDMVEEEREQKSDGGAFLSRFAAAMKENFSARRTESGSQYRPVRRTRSADEDYSAFDTDKPVTIDDMAEMVKRRNERMGRGGDGE